ncbi:LAME_0C04522g1_1 [Lachancea meyersii CBS 8951]|uniref:LAME_0C04522g1_1 n=1 Tax=Lachancea meyersii CBS 8951 TaxID=1266667 RepID=A0A1G4J0Y7_9SACH|nr:LAME_0C04522g1_1 [Lachancea meyersii CBS 8951]
MSEISAPGLSESVLGGSFAARSPEDDVIPTAIVIKNIPFAIKKEQLLEVIAKMSLPLPYAFNYHFDNGVFRGLAFANFATTDETTQVVHTLNGKEIGGRKLRVEYKKMLPQVERERIEREKREKRGQLEEQHRTTSALSLQSLNKSSSGSNNKNTSPVNPLGHLSSTDLATPSQRPETPSGGLSGLSGPNLPPTLSSNASSQMFQSFVGGVNSNGQGAPTNVSLALQPSMAPQPLLSAQNTATSMTIPSQSLAALSSERYYAPLPASANLPLPPQQLDFNDPDVLELYSQLLLFKDREKIYHELAYPVGLSAAQKRVINVLCSFLGLVEVYDPSFIIIRRKVLDHAALQSHLQQEGQLSLMQPLQPSSTGGSGMSRSHSYTSLLQAHATAAAAAGSNTTMSQAGQIPPPSQSPLLQPTAVHHLDSQNQQQQSILRQQSTHTPSSSILQNRIPTGYTNKHNTPSASNNPLLRNAGVSPTTAQIQPNTAQRMPSFYSQAPSTPSHGDNRFNSSQNLVPQHTNSSIHSNYSVNSFHDPAVAAADSQNHGMMYSSAQLGLGPELDGDLSRSLSGLDIQNKRNLWG